MMTKTKPVVLVIEDFDRVAALAAYFLRRGDYQPVVATTGIEGLRLARELSPALVLCDACLPDLNGPELLSVLRANPNTDEIPFILMSGYATARNAYPMPEAFLQKPFRMDEMLALVQTFAPRPRTAACDVDDAAQQMVETA